MQKQNGDLRIGTEEVEVILASDVVKAFRTVQKQGEFQNEQGGILVGYYDGSVKCLVISDITFPQDKDICNRSGFFRKREGHQRIMDELWEKSEHRKSYMGEWHTHNQKYPIPSTIDTNNWRKISRRKHNFHELYFIIVGTESISVWCVKKGKHFKLESI